MGGVALHGFDQIGDQVGPALILILDLGPVRLGLFLIGRNVINAAASEPKGQGEDGEQADGLAHGIGFSATRF